MPFVLLSPNFPTQTNNGQHFGGKKQSKSNENQRRDLQIEDSGSGRLRRREPPGARLVGFRGGEALRRPSQAVGAAPGAEAQTPLFPRRIAQVSRREARAEGKIGDSDERQGPARELDAGAEIVFGFVPHEAGEDRPRGGGGERRNFGKQR